MEHKFYYNPKTNLTICVIPVHHPFNFGTTYIKGYAKCSSQDEYNKETGERLAFLRAKRRYLKTKIQEKSERMREIKKDIVDLQKWYDSISKSQLELVDECFSLESELEEFEKTI